MEFDKFLQRNSNCNIELEKKCGRIGKFLRSILWHPYVLIRTNEKSD